MLSRKISFFYIEDVRFQLDCNVSISDSVGGDFSVDSSFSELFELSELLNNEEITSEVDCFCLKSLSIKSIALQQ